MKITFPYLIIALLCLFAIQARTQQRTKYHRKYINGYIVSNYGDTLFGRIKLEQHFKRNIRFIADDDTLQKSVRLPISNITTIKMNLMIFEKVLYKGKQTMFEKVAYGYYDLFAFKYLRDEQPENRYILKHGDETAQITDLNFEEMAEKYLFDCEELRTKIFAKQAGFEDLVTLFRQYNLWKKNNPSEE